jgi:hypothetical protein
MENQGQEEDEEEEERETHLWTGWDGTGPDEKCWQERSSASMNFLIGKRASILSGHRDEDFLNISEDDLPAQSNMAFRKVPPGKHNPSKRGS